MAIYITRNTKSGETGTTRRYNFSEVNSVSDRSIQNNIKISSPNQDSNDNTIFNLNGISRIVSFAFNIYNDGTDRSNGTHTSTVTTIQEQYDYLKNTFLTGDTGVEYNLVVEFDSVEIINMVGMINNLTPNILFNTPNRIAVNFEFEEGSNPFKVT